MWSKDSLKGAIQSRAWQQLPGKNLDSRGFKFLCLKSGLPQLLRNMTACNHMDVEQDSAQKDPVIQ